MSEKSINTSAYRGAQNVVQGLEGITQAIIPTNDVALVSQFFEIFLVYERMTVSDTPKLSFVKEEVFFVTPNGFILQLVKLNTEFETHFSGNVISLTVNHFNEVKMKLKTLGIAFWDENVNVDSSQRKVLFSAPDGTMFLLSESNLSNRQMNNENIEDLATPSPIHSNTIIPTTEDLFNVLGHCGVEWILVPTTNFDKMIDFFTNVIGYHLVTTGVPQSEVSFSRYALLSTVGGVTLELLEKRDNISARVNYPSLSLTVENLHTTKKRLQESKLGSITDIIGSENWGWFYISIPKCGLFQIQGPI